MPYVMTPRRFANLDRKRATTHLIAYQDYLAGFDFLKPILSADVGPEVMFDNAQHALFAHWMKSKTEEVNLALSAQKEVVASSPNARYLIQIYGMVRGEPGILEARHLRMLEDGKTEVVMRPMEYKARDYASAERLSDRRLVERQDSLWSDIGNTDGKLIQTRVERRDAIARFFSKPRCPFMKAQKRSADLHWKPKSHATRSITKWSIQR